MGTFIRGLLLGLGLGALFAPLRGQEMRRLLRTRFQELRGALPEQIDLNSYTQQITENATQTASSLKDYAQQATAEVKSAASSLGDLAQQATTQVKGTASDLSTISQQAATTVQGTASDLGTITQNASSDAKDAVTNTVQQVQETAGKVADTVQQITAQAQGTVSTVVEQVQNTASAIKDQVQAVTQQAQDTASDVAQQTKDATQQVVAQAKDTASDAKEQAQTTVQQLTEQPEDAVNVAIEPTTTGDETPATSSPLTEETAKVPVVSVENTPTTSSVDTSPEQASPAHSSNSDAVSDEVHQPLTQVQQNVQPLVPSETESTNSDTTGTFVEQDSEIGSISTIPGMEPEMQSKLEEQGVRTIEELLTQTRTRDDRIELSQLTDISTQTLRMLGDRAEFLQLQGVTDDVAVMLEEAGVMGNKDLRRRNPENLYSTLVEEHAKGNIATNVPDVDLLTQWIAEAMAWTSSQE